MRQRNHRTRSWQRGSARLVLAIVALSAAAGCGNSRSTSSSAIDPEIAASGFPFGTYSKEFTDPFMGRIRLAWTFSADGRWAEVPVALDGQTLPVPTVRGAYMVDGERLTIATDYPPAWGTSHHTWRLDGDLLWTTFSSSDVEADDEWFEMLDAQPWAPFE